MIEEISVPVFLTEEQIKWILAFTPSIGLSVNVIGLTATLEAGLSQCHARRLLQSPEWQPRSTVLALDNLEIEL